MSSAMQSNPDQSLAGQDQLPAAEPTAEHVSTISPMVAKSQEAFRHDLPDLLHDRYRWWVAYHGDERIGFAKSKRELYRQCLRRGLSEDQFVVRCVVPDAADNQGELLTPWV